MAIQKRILPSLMSADPLRLGAELDSLIEAGVRAVHVDILDGFFAPNLSSFSARSLEKIRKSYPHFFLDVHLMLVEPLDHLEAIIPWASRVTIHVESKGFEEASRRILSSGCELGIAIKPGTSLEILEGVVEGADSVTVMGVEPGFSGQAFIEGTVERVSQLKEMLKGIVIQVDGGMDEGTLLQCSIAGASEFVSGSTLFASEDRKKAFVALESIIQER